MGVVQLDGHLFRQQAKIGVFFGKAVEDILHRGRCQEILLAQAQFLALGHVVGRIEHLGDVFGLHLGFDRADIIALIERG